MLIFRHIGMFVGYLRRLSAPKLFHLCVAIDNLETAALAFQFGAQW